MAIVTKTKDLKTFSLIWFVIFTLIGFYPLLKGLEPRVYSVGLGMLFLLIALIKPQVLKSFYVLWVKMGELMGGVISKIIMFLLYFGFFTPISLILKLLRKDLLQKKIDKQTSSYWTTRETQPQSMKYQF
jgi:uncharacterized BrkB/YihY/UPF0761 family membrane protein